MRTLFKAILATVALAAPMYANAIPITWNYSGVCTGGDCDDAYSIKGTLTGDSTLDIFGDDGHLSHALLLGEVTHYSFQIRDSGGNIRDNVQGLAALGSYTLDSNRNIVGGSMKFDNLLLNVGAWSWDFFDIDCHGFRCSITDAEGSGSYTQASSVPEPATLSLLGLGLLGFGLIRRRRPG
jgi:hypothetical protein